MFISRETIEKAREASLVTVIGHYVELKKSGANWKGLSPFQDEKNASFVVTETSTKRIWKCFASGPGGVSGIDFIMQFENKSFIEAVKRVCEIAKIEIAYDLPENGIDAELWQKKRQRRQNAMEMLNEAVKYYKEALLTSDAANQYLASRHLHQDTFDVFELGYAPFAAYFTQKDLEVAEAVSLITSQGERGYSEFFKDRLMIPFHSPSGQVIGFAGRDLKNEDGVKYINSRNTSYYDKNSFLYGYHFSEKLLAKARKEGGNDFLYICEGYFNVMRLYELGYASVGTGSWTLSDAQIEGITKLSKKVVLFRDNDKPGLMANEEQIEKLLKAGCLVKVIRFPKDTPPKADVDDIGKAIEIKNAKVKAIERFFEGGGMIPEGEKYVFEQLSNWINKNTVSWLEWLISYKFGENLKSATPEDRAEFMQKIARCIALIPSQVVKSEWIDEAATIFKKKGLITCIKEKEAELKTEGKDNPYAEVEMREDGMYVMGNHICEFLMEVTARTDITLDRKNGKRKFGWECELYFHGQPKVMLTIPEEDLATSGRFYSYVMSYGFNYMNTNENHHRFLIQYFNRNLALVKSMHNAGWSEEAQLYFYSNAAFRIMDGQILKPSDKSIIMSEGNQGYKLTLLSESLQGNEYADFSKFAYKDSEWNISKVANIIKDAWSQDALLTCCYTVACCFFDVITKIHGNFMPIFWVWSSQASSGKTKLCTLNTQFFGQGRTHDLLNDNTSIPGIVAALAGIQNTVHVLDDFKRGMNYHKQIKLLQGFAQLNGHTIFDVESQREVTKIVRGGVFTTSNEIPTESIYNAFRTRLFVLELRQNADRTEEQYDAFERVVTLLDSNLSAVSASIIKHRNIIKEQYQEVHKELKKYYREIIGKQYQGVEDRYYESATFVSASIIIFLRNKLTEFPMTEQEIKDACVEKILTQIGYERQMQPLQEFWNLMQLAFEDSKNYGVDKLRWKLEYHTITDHVIDEESGEVQNTQIRFQGVALFFRFERLYQRYADTFKGLGQDISRKISEWEMKRMLENEDYLLKPSHVTRLMRDDLELEEKKTAKNKKPTGTETFRTMVVDYEKLAERYGLELLTPEELHYLKEPKNRKSA